MAVYVLIRGERVQIPDDVLYSEDESVREQWLAEQGDWDQPEPEDEDKGDDE